MKIHIVKRSSEKAYCNQRKMFGYALSDDRIYLVNCQKCIQIAIEEVHDLIEKGKKTLTDLAILKEANKIIDKRKEQEQK